MVKTAITESNPGKGLDNDSEGKYKNIELKEN